MHIARGSRRSVACVAARQPGERRLVPVKPVVAEHAVVHPQQAHVAAAQPAQLVLAAAPHGDQLVEAARWVARVRVRPADAAAQVGLEDALDVFVGGTGGTGGGACMVKRSEIGILGETLRQSHGLSVGSEVMCPSSRLWRAAQCLHTLSKELMVASYGLVKTAPPRRHSDRAGTPRAPRRRGT